MLIFSLNLGRERTGSLGQPALRPETGKPCGLSLQVRYGPPTTSFYLNSFHASLVVKNERGYLQSPSDMLNSWEMMVNIHIYLYTWWINKINIIIYSELPLLRSSIWSLQRNVLVCCLSLGKCKVITSITFQVCVASYFKWLLCTCGTLKTLSTLKSLEEVIQCTWAISVCFSSPGVSWSTAIWGKIHINVKNSGLILQHLQHLWAIFQHFELQSVKCLFHKILMTSSCFCGAVGEK